MKSPARSDVADALASYERLLEVGVGRRLEVAAALAADGCEVVAVDVDPVGKEHVDGTAGVDFREADVRRLAARAETAPPAMDPSTARDSSAVPDPTTALDPAYCVEAVYGLNLPAELQRPTLRLARAIDAACLFTTLGFEEPSVPVDRRTLDDETLYVARE